MMGITDQIRNCPSCKKDFEVRIFTDEKSKPIKFKVLTGNYYYGGEGAYETAIICEYCDKFLCGSRWCSYFNGMKDCCRECYERNSYHCPICDNFIELAGLHFVSCSLQFRAIDKSYHKKFNCKYFRIAGDRHDFDQVQSIFYKSVFGTGKIFEIRRCRYCKYHESRLAHPNFDEIIS